MLRLRRQLQCSFSFTIIVEFQDVHLRKASSTYPVAADIKITLMDTLLQIKRVKVSFTTLKGATLDIYIPILAANNIWIGKAVYISIRPWMLLTFKEVAQLLRVLQGLFECQI